MQSFVEILFGYRQLFDGDAIKLVCNLERGLQMHFPACIPVTSTLFIRDCKSATMVHTSIRADQNNGTTFRTHI